MTKTYLYPISAVGVKILSCLYPVTSSMLEIPEWGKTSQSDHNISLHCFEAKAKIAPHP